MSIVQTVKAIHAVHGQRTTRASPRSFTQCSHKASTLIPRQVSCRLFKGRDDDQGTKDYIESTEPLPEPTEGDFFEGEQWEWLGKALLVLVPVIFLATVGVGIFAAQTYNEGASVYLQSAKSDDDTAKLFTPPALQ